jgi:hypothetical protein
MEPDQERITRITSRWGATEEEALVLFHLQRAATAWAELPADQTKTMPGSVSFSVHYQALFNMILARIVRRDHPGD